MPAGGQEEAGKVRSCGFMDDLMGRLLGGRGDYAESGWPVLQLHTPTASGYSGGRT